MSWLDRKPVKFDAEILQAFIDSLETEFREQRHHHAMMLWRQRNLLRSLRQWHASAVENETPDTRRY